MYGQGLPMEPYYPSPQYPSPQYPYPQMFPPRPRPRPGLSAAAIVGIVIAVLLVLALAITLPIVLLTGGDPDPPPQPQPPGPWSSFSPCTVTCGRGIQVRYRDCYGQMDCRTYEDLPCTKPECDKPCSEKLDCSLGTRPDANCNVCVCDVAGYQLVTGKVTNEEGIPIPYAQVKYANLPVESKVMADHHGGFVLCLPTLSRLTFSANGFLDKTVDAIPTNMMVMLEEIEFLHMTVHPESKVRLVNESAFLCCVAEGHPDPVSYQWYKNDQMYGSGGSTLELVNLDADDEASYRCKASNDIGDVAYSNAAYVQVRATKEDYCPSTPMENYKVLPDGCLYNGEPTIDLGRCSGRRCGAGAEDEHCWDGVVEGNVLCCRANTSMTDSFSVTGCTDGRASIQLTKILTCDCHPCTDQKVLVYGKVRAASSYLPLEGVIVKLGGDAVAETSVDGSYRFEMDVRDERVLLDFHAKDYISRTEVLRIPPSPDSGLVRDVYLMKKSMKKTIQARDPAPVPFKMGHIQFQADSFFDIYNNPMTGSVLVGIDSVDPRDPGSYRYMLDLETVDAEGMLAGLGTYGIVYLSLSDIFGRPVKSNGLIKIYVEWEALRDDANNDITDVKVWILNGEAYWRYAATLNISSGRRKRQATRGDAMAQFQIFDSDFVLNIDRVEPVCYVKVRAYYGDDNSHQSTRGVVHGLSISPPAGTGTGPFGEESTWPFTSYQSAYLGRNGACVRALCSDTFNVDRILLWSDDYAGRSFMPRPNSLPQSYRDDLRFEVNENKVLIDGESRSSAPFYNSDSRRRCNNADDSELSIDFYREPMPNFMSNTVSMFVADVPVDQPTEMAFNQRAKSTNKYTVCFAKLRMPANVVYANAPDKYMAMSNPKAAAFEDGAFSDLVGLSFGYRESEFEQSFDYRATCVEVKASGEAQSGKDVDVNNVVSVPFDSNGAMCAFRLNANMQSEPVAQVDPTPGAAGDHNMQTVLQGDFLTGNMASENGLYCFSHETLETAKATALGNCNAGSDNMPSQDEINGQNYFAEACLDWCEANPCDNSFICSAIPSGYTCTDPNPPLVAEEEV